MEQAKRTLKGMFRRRSSRFDNQASSGAPDNHASPASTVATSNTQTDLSSAAKEGEPVSASLDSTLNIAAPTLDTNHATGHFEPASPSLADQVDQAGNGECSHLLSFPFNQWRPL